MGKEPNSQEETETEEELNKKIEIQNLKKNIIECIFSNDLTQIINILENNSIFQILNDNFEEYNNNVSLVLGKYADTYNKENKKNPKMLKKDIIDYLITKNLDTLSFLKGALNSHNIEGYLYVIEHGNPFVDIHIPKFLSYLDWKKTTLSYQGDLDIHQKYIEAFITSMSKNTKIDNEALFFHLIKNEKYVEAKQLLNNKKINTNAQKGSFNQHLFHEIGFRWEEKEKEIAKFKEIIQIFKSDEKFNPNIQDESYKNSILQYFIYKKKYKFAELFLDNFKDKIDPNIPNNKNETICHTILKDKDVIKNLFKEQDKAYPEEKRQINNYISLITKVLNFSNIDLKSKSGKMKTGKTFLQIVKDNTQEPQFAIFIEQLLLNHYIKKVDIEIPNRKKTKI